MRPLVLSPLLCGGLAVALLLRVSNTQATDAAADVCAAVVLDGASATCTGAGNGHECEYTPAPHEACAAASAAGDGGHGAGVLHGGAAPISAECLAAVNERQCALANHVKDFHASFENTGYTTCKTQKCMHAAVDDDLDHDCYDDDEFPPINQTCKQSQECSTCGHYRCLLCLDPHEDVLYSEPLGVKFLFIVCSLFLGTVFSIILLKLPPAYPKPPFSVLMFVLGMVLGCLADYGLLGCALSDSVNAWKHQDPHSIIYALLPPLLFESAFNVNYHVFTKVLKSSMLFASTGVLISTGPC
eukprot:SAG22_NODE_839_length_6905_cov_2.344696_1_plen_299_part_10